MATPVLIIDPQKKKALECRGCCVLAEFWADAQKAKELLGWEAKHTVEDMCRSAWNFAKNSGKSQS